MKKKTLLATLLTATALLTACSSGVSEKDFKALEDRVTALEKGTNPLESVNPNADSKSSNKDTTKKPKQVEPSGATITSKEGVQISFNSGGIAEFPTDIVGVQEKDIEGNHFAYVVLDWKFTGTESTYLFDYYGIELTDGEITISDLPFTDYNRTAENLRLEGVSAVSTPTTPKETGKTIVVFKIPEAAYVEAESWSLKFEKQSETIPVSF